MENTDNFGGNGIYTFLYIHVANNIVVCRKDTNYKRVAMASLVQAVYFLELDRQENRTQENALAPSWWIPFKYKLTQILIDERDGSIFGAIFEWDRSAALVDSLPIRPRGAPKAVWHSEEHYSEALQGEEILKMTSVLLFGKA